MRTFEFETFDQSYYHLIKVLLEEGKEVSPRGQLTKEISPVSITIKNPRGRIISHPARKLNYGFMLAEFLWIMRGSNNKDEIAHYNKQWSNFSDDGETLNGAYGQRIFNWNGFRKTHFVDGIQFGERYTVNQVEEVVKKLKNDLDTRHATIILFDPTNDFEPTKDVPCTNMFRFKIRDGKLDMIGFMRSNDIWLGYPYDVFNFTMLQEIIADRLNVDVGTYTHIVDSFHLYEMHFDAAKHLVESGETNMYSEMGYTKLNFNQESLDLVQKVEKLSRNMEFNGHFHTIYYNLLKMGGLLSDIGSLIASYNYKKYRKLLENPYTPEDSYVNNIVSPDLVKVYRK